MPPKAKPTTSHSSQPAEAAKAEELKTQASSAKSGIQPVENHGPSRKPQAAHTAPDAAKQSAPSAKPTTSHSSESTDKAE